MVPYLLRIAYSMLRRLAFLSLSAALTLVTPTTLFGSTPVQIDTARASYNFYFDPSIPLSQDSDYVTIHDDFYGLPWQAFTTNGALPLSWATRLNATLEMVIAWDKPVFLALEMLSGNLRTCPAQNASDAPDGTPQVAPFSGCTQCYDFNPATNPAAASLQKAFALYAAFYTSALLDHGSPKGLLGVNIGAELNLEGGRLCGEGWWEGVVAWHNGVYEVLRGFLDARNLTAAAVPVFPSIQVEALMGVQDGQACAGELAKAAAAGGAAPTPALTACIAQGVARVAPLRRDAFGVSTYPPPPAMMPGKNGGGGGPQPWYLGAVIAALPPQDASTFRIAETGWNRVPMVVNLGNGSVGSNGQGGGGESEDPPLDCQLLVDSSPALANSWLEYLVREAEGRGWAWVTWWSDTDLLYDGAMSSCPCDTPPLYQSSCVFISAFREIIGAEGGAPVDGEVEAKGFGAMGLRALNGSTTLLWDTLQRARGQGGRGGG